jgi:hypothetical protein
MIERHQLAAAEARAECRELVALQQQQLALRVVAQLMLLKGQNGARICCIQRSEPGVDGACTTKKTRRWTGYG